jgi:hypothetical protein
MLLAAVMDIFEPLIDMLYMCMFCAMQCKLIGIPRLVNSVVFPCYSSVSLCNVQVCLGCIPHTKIFCDMCMDG